MRAIFLFFGLVIIANFCLADLNMEPPKAKPYLKRRVQRMKTIRDYKFRGIIGEAEGAMLKIRTLKGINKNEQKKVNEVVKEENADRKKIIDEIIKFNKLNKEQQDYLFKSFYTVERNTSAKGTYYYEKGTWTKKF